MFGVKKIRNPCILLVTSILWNCMTQHPVFSYLRVWVFFMIFKGTFLSYPFKGKRKREIREYLQVSFHLLTEIDDSVCPVNCTRVHEWFLMRTNPLSLMPLSTTKTSTNKCLLSIILQYLTSIWHISALFRGCVSPNIPRHNIDLNRRKPMPPNWLANNGYLLFLPSLIP